MQHSMTLGELQQRLGGTLQGDAGVQILNLRSLETAGPNDLSVIYREKFLPEFKQSLAGAYLVEENLDIDFPKNKNLLCIKNARLNFSKATDLIYPIKKESGTVHPDIHIPSNAKIGKNTTIYSKVFIGENVIIGNSCTIYPGAFIGDEVTVSDNTEIHSNCSIYRQTQIGKNCVIGANTVLGSDGFGYEKNSEGNYIKIRHVGTVVLEDFVEIGSGCTIDRGTYDSTIIKKRTKLDNLIHIGHNVQIGEHNLITALVGFAGSSSTGKNCIFLGQSGVSQGIHIHEETILRSKSALYKSNPSGGIWSGDFAKPFNEHIKIMGTFPYLPEMKKRVKQLEKKVIELEEKLRRVLNLKNPV